MALVWRAVDLEVGLFLLPHNELKPVWSAVCGRGSTQVSNLVFLSQLRRSFPDVAAFETLFCHEEVRLIDVLYLTDFIGLADLAGLFGALDNPFTQLDQLRG